MQWARGTAGAPGARRTGVVLTGQSLRVDRIACSGHGVCAELVPELVTLDEWGYPVLAPGPVPQDLVRHARRGVSACPALALTLTAAPA